MVVVGEFSPGGPTRGSHGGDTESTVKYSWENNHSREAVTAPGADVTAPMAAVTATPAACGGQL